MKGFRKTYSICLLLLVSVLFLSTRDTLHLLHEVAHLVPNPFHHHSHSHHTHVGHKHHVLDHLETKREKFTKLKTSSEPKKQKEVKKELKKYIYPSSASTVSVSIELNFKAAFSFIPQNYKSHVFPPPAPPPETRV